MLRCAKTIQEQIAASVSVAVTAKELYRYEEAYEYFMKVEMLEAQLNLSNLKVTFYRVVENGVAFLSENSK